MNPESNVFLIINLGCEMLYVIDQRLKAQTISEEKSVEVIRDITSILLEPKFIDRIIFGSQKRKALLTAEHCKFMLADIACCSLMRIDEASMGKLWNLMTMVFKWQMFVINYPQQLLDITFRHLDGVAKLYPDVKKTILVDYTKNKVLSFWNSNEENIQTGIYRTIKLWLDSFHVKVSLLIRLGFQRTDSNFHNNPMEPYFKEFAEGAGDNIYAKSLVLAFNKTTETETAKKKSETSYMDTLRMQLNVTSTSYNEDTENNLVFDDVHLKMEKETPPDFVRLKPVYNPSPGSWEDFLSRKDVGNSTAAQGKDFRMLQNKGD